ncbi:T9SS type A sorting domain-containing protein [Bacteroidota bacterium]
MKKTGYLLIISILFLTSYQNENQDSDIVNIPDQNFLNALIREGVDTNGDSLISYTEAEKVITLNVFSRNISNLAGIEAFVNLETLNCANSKLTKLDISNNTLLTSLNCRSNQLSSLDVSYNAKLNHIDCSYNQLSSLDVSNNTELKDLSCHHNNLDSLDVSNNTALELLWCERNQLSSLDVSNNNALTRLECHTNQISSLDVSNNTNLGHLQCSNNELNYLNISQNTALQYLTIENMLYLRKVCVWATPFPPEGLEVDTTDSPNVEFTTNCENFKVNIPDQYFLEALIREGVDTNGDSLISYAEAEAITKLEVQAAGRSRDPNEFMKCGLMTDATGIEAFINLQELYIDRNQLTYLDLSNNRALRILNAQANLLTDLNIRNCTELRTLDLTTHSGSDCRNRNHLSYLDISKNTKLNQLAIGDIPTLLEVCVWTESFPPAGLTLSSVDQNVKFTTICSQNIVHIPDTSFLKALIHEGVDTNGDSLISYAEAEQITSLDVSDNEISDMTGIVAFVNLDALDCHGNQLTSLNVLNNTALTELYCWDNQLSNLDVSKNTELTGLWCFMNKLSVLDVSKNTKLIGLHCWGNQLRELDVTNNTALELLCCFDNRLTSLDITKNIALTMLECWDLQLTKLNVLNNTELTSLRCGQNQLTSLNIANNRNLKRLDINAMPSLHEVCVWTRPFPSEGLIISTSGSPNVYFTTECIYNENVFIPDQVFLNTLLEKGVDTDGNNLISFEEAESVNSLNLNNKGIKDLTGINAFINLDTLDCSYNQLTSLNVWGCRSLKYLVCYRNQINELDISDHPSLTYLECGKNCYSQSLWQHDPLTSLNVSGCENLEELYCYFSHLDTLNVMGCTSLEILDCSWNELDELGLSTNASLRNLACIHDTLSHLDVSACNALESLNCTWNGLIELDVSTNTALTNLECNINHLSSLDVSNCTALQILDCSRNRLRNLDVTNNLGLKNLSCGDNQILCLDLSKNTALEELSCWTMPILREVCVWTESFTGEVNVECEFSPFAYFTTNCKANKLVLIPDTAFLYALLEKGVDTNGDSLISFYEAEEITNLDVSDKGICDLTGIEAFVNLVSLACHKNQLSRLNLSCNTKLIDLNCREDELSDLDVFNNRSLAYFDCSGNQLTELDVSRLISLKILNCSGNQLKSLDLSNCRSLGSLATWRNHIDIGQMPGLTKVCVWKEPFPGMDIRVNTTGSENVYFTIHCRHTGIEETSLPELSIYPNPAIDKLIIQTSRMGLYTIEIITPNGQLMYAELLDGAELQIDISAFQKGIYFIMVKSDEFVRVERFIKL